MAARPRNGRTHASAKAQRRRLMESLSKTISTSSALERSAPEAGACASCGQPYEVGEPVLFLTPPPGARAAWRVVHRECSPPSAQAA